jgi:predicted ATP-grasp superfamily ATP-dependent carboligase
VQRPNAVIIKLDSLTGLQSSRILAGYGIPVIGVADDANNFCCRTNSCKQVLTADTSNEELIDALISLGKRLGSKSVILPCSDDSVLAISAHRDELTDWYEFVIPEHETIDLLMDKVKFYKYLELNGFPIPQTYYVTDKSELKEIANHINYPCVVKPPRPAQSWFKYFKGKALKIRNRQELDAVSDNCLRAADTFIIQEWIDGRDSNIYQYYYYFDKYREPVINYTSRKLRQWHIETGEACLAERCLVEPVPRKSIDIYSRIQYKGITSLEIKIDENNGKHFIIEPDIGRPNTSIGLVEASGVPILYTMYCDALSLPMPSDSANKSGSIKWISLQRDIMAAAEYYVRGELSFKEWLKSIKGVKTFAIFSIRDPLPFIFDFCELLKRTIESAGRGITDFFKRL